MLLKKAKSADQTSALKPEVALEITNYCNTNCVFCCRKKMERKKGFISEKLYEKIINEISESGYTSLNLTGFGEALLHKRIIEFIKYAKEKGLYVKMFTNGFLLTQKISKMMMESELDEIIISIDSITREEYNKVRGNLDFDQILANLHDCVDTKNKFGFKTIITIQATVYDDFKSVKEIYNSLHRTVDRITFQSAFNWGGAMGGYKGPMAGKEISDSMPCQLLWYNRVVRWNGDVSLCCVDYDSKVNLGNVGERLLDEIWNGENMKKLKKLHLDGNKINIELCRKCNLFPIWW